MSNTPSVSQVLPNFSANRSNSASNELKSTNNNNNFNQILKNEVASKVKKAPVNTVKQPAENRTTKATPVMPNNGVSQESASSEKKLSSLDEESDESDNTNLTISDETSTLLNFVGDLNALARLDKIVPEEISTDTSELELGGAIAAAPINIEHAENIGTALADYAESTVATDKTLNKLSATPSTVSTSQVDAAPVIQTPNSTVKSDEKDTNQAFNALSPAPMSDVLTNKIEKPGAPTSISLAADMQAINKGEKSDASSTIQIAGETPLNLEKGLTNRPTSELNVDEKKSATQLMASPPSVDAKTELSSTHLNSKISDAKELNQDEPQVNLNANERSASDKFSLNLKGLAQESRQNNFNEQNKNEQEFKITDMPRAESLPASAPIASTIEANSVSPASNFIGPRVGSKAWDQAIGQKIVWMVAGGEQSAQLTLNPPDLGPVQVVLSISDNQVDASFVSSHLDVREAIEAAAPKLREMMDNAGITLSGFSVGTQSTPSGNPSGSDGNQRNNNANASRIQGEQQSNPTAIATPANRTTNPQGLVDTFV